MVLENNIKALHQQSTFVSAIQAGSDLPSEEILTQPVGNWPIPSDTYYERLANVSINNNVKKDTSDESEYVNSWNYDLRGQHQVTSVVNQGGCGACVYFAAAATIESYWARQGHGLVHLSPQQLNDCARNEARGNHGCQHGGGTFVPTFDYIRDHGLTSSDNYPYVAKVSRYLRLTRFDRSRFFHLNYFHN